MDLNNHLHPGRDKGDEHKGLQFSFEKVEDCKKTGKGDNLRPVSDCDRLELERRWYIAKTCWNQRQWSTSRAVTCAGKRENKMPNFYGKYIHAVHPRTVFQFLLAEFELGLSHHSHSKALHKRDEHSKVTSKPLVSKSFNWRGPPPMFQYARNFNINGGAFTVVNGMTGALYESVVSRC